MESTARKPNRELYSAERTLIKSILTSRRPNSTTAEALKAILANKGVTFEKSTMLHSILNSMVREKDIRKEGRGYLP